MNQLEGFLEDLLYDSRADPDTLKIFLDWATDEWEEGDCRISWLEICLKSRYSTGTLCLHEGELKLLEMSPWWAVEWLLSPPLTTLRQVRVEEGYGRNLTPSGKYTLEWEPWLQRAMIHVDPEEVYRSKHEATYAVKESTYRWLQDLVKQCLGIHLCC